MDVTTLNTIIMSVAVIIAAVMQVWMRFAIGEWRKMRRQATAKTPTETTPHRTSLFQRKLVTIPMTLVVFAFPIVLLAYELKSPEPVSRQTIFRISTYVASLVAVTLIQIVTITINRMWSVQKNLIAGQNLLFTDVGALFEGLKQTARAAGLVELKDIGVQPRSS